MNNLVTLIIILHNRHKNLDRLLYYYKGVSFKIIIADSSKEKHKFSTNDISYKHLYIPNITFTKKIELALAEVATPYVVMCADDDFIIPDSIIRCVEFLEANKDYAIAQGSCIKYYKASIDSAKINFGLLYQVKSYDIEINDPFFRLEEMFDNYRSVLYAVHRTDILRLAFKSAGEVVKNLYLNEYLTAVVPIICGKYKELPILYQVREFAEDSDDKITDNLDQIFSNEKYLQERESFIELLVTNASPIVTLNKEEVRNKISSVLQNFSTSPLIGNKEKKISLKKRVGIILKEIPVLGSWLIERNRRIEQSRDLKGILKTESDRKNISIIESVLKSTQL